MSDYGTPPDPNLPPAGQPAYGAQPPYGAPAASYAHWGKRVGASLIDGLLYLPLVILVNIGVAIGDAVGTILLLLGFVGYVALFVWNTCIKQGTTGQSIGKGVLGIKLINEGTGQPIGAGMSFVRQLAHILDALPCYLGFLWPLWDQKRQTFADKVLGTVVVEAA